MPLHEITTFLLNLNSDWKNVSDKIWKTKVWLCVINSLRCFGNSDKAQNKNEIQINGNNLAPAEAEEQINKEPAGKQMQIHVWPQSREAVCDDDGDDHVGDDDGVDFTVDDDDHAWPITMS